MATLTLDKIEYMELVKEFASIYLIPKKRMLRRRFRRLNGRINNGFSPIEEESKSIYEFLKNNDILTLKCNGDACYVPALDLVLTKPNDYDKRIEELVHAITFLPLLSRKKHIEKKIPSLNLREKEYLDHLVVLDFTEKTGKYPKLRKKLILEAEIGIMTNEWACAEVLRINDHPEERFKIVQKYLRDVTNAAVRGDFDWNMYTFTERVKNY